jgi:hypothetical protein
VDDTDGGDVLDDVDESEQGKASAAASADGPGAAETEKRLPVAEFVQRTIQQAAGAGEELVKQVQQGAQKVPGCVECKPDEEDGLRAVYDLGHGHVHVKFIIEGTTLVFRRAKGDLLSFGKVWESVQKM